MVKVCIDYECPARAWWDAGGLDLWASVTDDPDESSVVLDESLAQSVIAQAAAIPGWDGGPEYAPHPLRLDSVADDEDAHA